MAIRFTLRDLFLATTMIAVVIGMCVIASGALQLLVVGSPARSHAELKEQAEIALEETGGADVLETEAKAILRNCRARPNKWEDFKNYPATLKLDTLLHPNNQDVWVVADAEGLPAHVVIRFGSHAHYAYIWIFDPADMPLGKIEGVEHLSGRVYLSEIYE